MNLAQRLTSKQLAEFFEEAGIVSNTKIVTDRNTGRSKGVGYVEFISESSIPAALALSGRKLAGIPVSVQPTEAEKNRIAAEQAEMLRLQKLQELGTGRLHVSNLHQSINEGNLRSLFGHFGIIDHINLPKNPDSSLRGFAYIQ